MGENGYKFQKNHAYYMRGSIISSLQKYKLYI